jgi:hypothetical protein
MRVALLVILALFVATSAFAATEVSPFPGTPSQPEGDFPYDICIQLVDIYSVGVGWDGTYLWSSNGDQAGGGCQFYIWDDLGNMIDIVPQGGGATGWGHRDLAWVCICDGMMGSYSSNIDVFDSYLGGTCAFEGFFNGPISPCRAMAWDGYYVYTCGFGEYLYRGHWDCLFGTGVTWEIIGGPFDGCYGLSYDCDNDCLWMTTADYTGNLYQLDMAGNIIGTYTFLPEFDIQGGCEMAYTPTWGTRLAVLQQSSPDQICLYDVDSQCAAEEETWGSIKAMFK